MSWKKSKGYSIRENQTTEQLWDYAQSVLGLDPEERSLIIAMSFGDFINSSEIKPGLVRELTGNSGKHFMRLDEYDPENLKFSISISSEHLDKNTMYLILRNQISKSENGAVWNIEVLEKRSLFAKLLGGGFGNNISGMFHGYERFKQT